MRIHIFTETGIAQDPPAPLETLDSAIVWSELRMDGATKLDALLKGDDTLIVNTKARRTYLQPKLVGLSGAGVLVSALTDRDPSGTPAGPEKIYLLIEL